MIKKIFSCCRDHDHCYDRAVDEKKCFDVAWEYVDNYNWKCQNSTAVCEGFCPFLFIYTILGAQDPCKAALCACDTAAVQCWSKYPKPTKKPKCNRTFLYQFSKWFRPQK